ncbi:restriction endonuclease subunit S [Nocardia beijingensis]|uniref:restriction endonuclease subunit S n=1 Tax=Nocardia beijingensis TaxID=95162 RepID=UPI000AE31B21|nr:restriction endonuclease subunit S [Nocardia beijingensis]
MSRLNNLPIEIQWPAHWRDVPLWSLFDRVKDVGHPDEDMLSVYRAHGVVKKDGRDDNFNKTAENRNIYQLVDDGWLVVNRMKAWQGSVGISTLRGIVSGHYLCFRPNHSEDPRYLNWLLRSQVYATEYGRMSRGVRPSQIEIDNDELRGLRIALPSREEQRRIADFLEDEISRISSLAEAQVLARSALLERRATRVFEAVTGVDSSERKPSGLAWVATIPISWRSVKVGYVARIGSGHTPSRSKPEWWQNCDIPWITTGEVSQVRDDRREVLTETRECISKIGLENSAAELHPRGTVVLCRTASAGYSAVMGTEMATSQDFVTWTCGPNLDPYYLLWCLRAMRDDLLGRLAIGSTHKTIYMPDLQALRITLPPLDNQRRIVDEIRKSNATVDRAVDAIDRQLSLLAERRQALITAAVSGQLDVTTARPSFS